MKPSKALILGLGCAAFGLASVRAEDASGLRVWTDSKGRQVEATFIGLEGDSVSIQNRAGAIFNLQLAQLSPADQAFAKTAKPAVTYVATNSTVAQAALAIDKLVGLGLNRGAAKIAKANAEILADKTLSAERKKADLREVPKPNALMTDEQFVRRVYVDIAGRIPNYQEAKDFLQNGSPTKRAKLIDQLLDSPGYASNTYNYFAEMLRVKDRLEQQNLRGVPYINWLQKQVASNAPWDQMVKAMLTAEGKMWHNGAAGYLIRDAGMPLDNLANTLAVFLGTDVACAQCHNHPFADWTQKQFYEMAAYFGATSTNLIARANRRADPSMAMNATERLMPDIKALMEKAGMDPLRAQQTVGQYMGANRVGVANLPTNGMKLPHDFHYPEDGKPNDPVSPKLITWSKNDKALPAYKTAAKGADNVRQEFANWVVHPTNPRFGMAIANRMWKRAFGIAVAEPVTNLDDPDKASNPELLKHLAAEMVRVKFNLKEFMRIIYNTQSYQHEATTAAVPMGEPYYFQGPLLRRMTAEQAWDSYMTLVLPDSPDLYTKPLDDLYSKSIDLDLTNPKLDAMTVMMKYSAFQNMGAKEAAMTGTLGGDDDGMMMMDKKGAKKDTAAADDMMMTGPKTMKLGNQILRRAAELEQPAPGGTFLADFGQSPRLLIDGGSKAGSVPQVLMLMNGQGQQMLCDPAGQIYKTMNKVTSPADKVEVVFMSILSRKPTLQEKDIAKRGMEGSGDDGYGNLIWALVNTREFMFLQ